MTTASNLTGKYRIASIDLLRGIVMLIMAIDHVRDNFQLGHPDPTDLNTTTPALFFTRWDHAFLRADVCIPKRGFGVSGGYAANG